MWSGSPDRGRVFPIALVVLLLGATLRGEAWWSLRRLARPAVPVVKDPGWARNPIDRFILSELEAAGLRPAPPADRRLFIRRASLDLLGLPPSPAEVEAFAADPSPEAHEQLIERLLASPHHGERWARHWLDVVRFAESHGFEFDKPRDHAWPYRDYVIRSFNEDKPYTLFVKEQIAGDVLEPVTPHGIAATGFLVAGPWDEAGSKLQKSEVMRARMREEELEDTIAAVAQTFLGLTVNCARCHDHKFDPIPQRDYYRLSAVFGGVRHGERPLLSPAERRAREEQGARLRADIDRLEGRLDALEDAARARVAEGRRRPGPPLPSPLVRFDFEAGARDQAGGLHGALEGGAVVERGRLRLHGKGAFLRTGPLDRALTEKTLEAWVSVGDLGQRGGGVISLETPDGRVFDAVVFAEREEGKWIAGSEVYSRSRDLAAPKETAPPGELVHLAITYAEDGRIAVYRNGLLCGEPYSPRPAPPTFPAGGARLLLGLRHTGAANGFFQGGIEEARLYDRALSGAEVESLFRQSGCGVGEADLLGAMGEGERAERRSLAAELGRARKGLRALEDVPLAYAACPEEAGPTFVLLRGDVEKRGEAVGPGGLSAVAAPPGAFELPAGAPEGLRRLRFAEWVGSAENPLTPRVIANRIWHYHFGRGIVATPSDFGVNGERPTHPRLLDWLACELIEGGWSLKRLHRLILTSSTYRQSSRGDPRAAEVDAENRLLARFGARRLEAEAIRDSLLAVSGELNPALYGPGFRPFTVQVFNSYLYTPLDAGGPEFNRRSIYRHVVNSAKDPVLDALDCPDPSTKTPGRAITTTPLQSLALMNDPFVLRQSRKLAERLKRDGGGEVEGQVDLAYRLALGRPPSPAEARSASGLAHEHGLESLAWALFNSSEFLYLR